MNYDSNLNTADHSTLPSEATLTSAARANGPAPLSNEPYSLVDAHSIRAREEERAQLRADIDEFLARGGKVTTLAPNSRADLPKPPQNNYGKGSI